MPARYPFLIASLLAIQFWLASACAVEKAHIAVASNFAPAMKEIVQLFETNKKYQLTVSYGSSGKLYAQILHGAPFDVFMSADQQKPAALAQQNRIATDTLFTYAKGRLALWAPGRDTLSLLDIQQSNSHNFKRFAIANPKVAPYGQAAMEVLEQLNFTEQQKLVFGENIAQAFQFVASGNADLGLVAVSQIVQQRLVNTPQVYLIPVTLHSPIRQDAVLLDRGKDNPVAMAFITFLRSDPAQGIIQKFGYDSDAMPAPEGV